MTTILNYLVSFGNNILRGKSGSIFSANFMEHDHINTTEKHLLILLWNHQQSFV